MHIPDLKPGVIRQTNKNDTHFWQDLGALLARESVFDQTENDTVTGINKAAMKMKHARVKALIEQISEAVVGKG